MAIRHERHVTGGGAASAAHPAFLAINTLLGNTKTSLSGTYHAFGFGKYAHRPCSNFPSADYVDGLTVFNIGGNKYRLIAAVHYNRQKLYIRAVLTHAEYDRDNWKRRS